MAAAGARRVRPTRSICGCGAGGCDALHRGVYAVGHAALRREGTWLAAVLALGPGEAYLSHASAAALWGLIGGSGAGGSR